jgi:hypothetical protein
MSDKLDEKAMLAVNRAVYNVPVGGGDGQTFIVPSATQDVLRCAITAYLHAIRPADTAPAAMPGEIELVELLRASIKVDASGLAPAVVSHYIDGFDEAARAILDLFAPILAEKEATIDRLMAVEQADLLPLTHPVFSLPAHVRPFKWAKLVAKLQARALAAEAALAAERERAAQIGYRVCAETRHVTLGDKVAAAIRQE